jgi:Na+/H+ antiporter NhaC
MMRFRPFLTILLVFTACFALQGQETSDTLSAEQPQEQIARIQYLPVPLDQCEVILRQENELSVPTLSGLPESGNFLLLANGDSLFLESYSGQAPLDLEVDEKGKLYYFTSDESGGQLYHLSRRKSGDIRLVALPLWLSILPPLVAILLALLVREVIISLFAGIWTGAFIAGGMRIDSIYYFFVSFFEVIEKYVIAALTDGGHIAIIVFSLLIGGMVAVISRNGGMAGVVNSLSRYANTPRSSQFITWLLGVAIFFDDYANTLIVGNTMRSVTDSFRISREKLAYIVDSTAAPVAAVAFITTWIGAELGFIESGLTKLNTFDMEISAYSLFLSSLKYSFYPVMTLAFILMLIYTQRDYGPMYKAETRARTTGRVSAALSEDEDEPNMEDLSPVKGAPKRWQHAVFPVLTVIIMTIIGLVATGMNTTYDDLVATGARLPNAGWGTIWAAMPALWEGESPGFFLKLGKLIGNADSYTALLWASLSGATLAVIITLGARIMRLMDTMHSLLTGFKAMLPAVIILTLAWSLAITTDELYTADFITTALAGNLSPYLIPPLVFILAALISFSTGSSWSTMTILYPIAIPTAWILSTEAGLDPEVSMEILLNVIAVVLAASVLGDHCSPISDTTILSSLASDCNHIDHVRTQMPYALTVGSVSLIACWLSTFLGGGWLISSLILLLGLVLLYFIVLKWGRKNVDYVKEEA